MPKRKKTNFVLAFLIILLGAAGIFIGQFVRDNNVNIDLFLKVFLIELGLIVLLFITNLILMKVLKNKKYDNKKMEENIFKKKKLAEENLKKYYNSIRKRISISNIYFIILIFLFMSIYTFIPILIGLEFFVVYMVSGYVVYEILANISKQKIYDERINEITKEEFPIFWEMMNNILKEFNIKKPIKCYLELENNAAVIEKTKYNEIFIGLPLIQMLSEEELKGVIIHELLHIELKHTSDSYNIDKMLQRFENINEDKTEFFDKLTNVLLIPIGFILYYDYETYKYVSQKVRENEVDHVIKEKANPQDFINGLAKIDVFGLFYNNEGKYTFLDVFKNDAPCENYCDVIFEKFLDAYLKNKEFWDCLIVKRLPQRIDSHNHFKYRMEILGVDSFKISFENTIPEKDKFVEKGNKIYVSSIDADEYSNYRQYNYVRPLDLITDYETGKFSDKPIEKFYVANAYRSFGQLDKALEIYNSLLDERSESPKLIFEKGTLLLALYDNEGINYIYKAMKLHKQYIDKGCIAIAEYTLKMGLLDELEKIRKYMDEHRNYIMNVHYKIYIDPSDKFYQTKLDQNIINEIVDFCKQDQRVGKIMIVDKKLYQKERLPIVGVAIEQKYHNEINDIMERIYDYLFDQRTETYLLLCLSTNHYYHKKFFYIKNSTKYLKVQK